MRVRGIPLFMTLLILVPGFVLLLAGCHIVEKMPVEYDVTAKELTAPADKALIYIMRPSREDWSTSYRVTCDGEYVGATEGTRYIFTFQEPGPHAFVSRAENRGRLDIVLEAGNIYYLEQVIREGVQSARNRLTLLDPAAGREKLLLCTLGTNLVESIADSEEFFAAKAALEKERKRQRTRARH